MVALNRTSADIETLRPVKVLQFGEGNFLRAFVDWMVDLMNEHSHFDGDVMIVQPIQKGLGALLNEQQGLYHVLLNGIYKGKLSTERRLITCVRGVLNPYQSFQKFLELAENPDLKFIISNTTESGITFNAHDTAPNVLPECFPGKLTALLYRRFVHFNGAADKAPIIIPCELIDKNGQALRDVVLAYVSLWKLSPDFKHWIAHEVIFCNTLVDRIVPGFPKDTIDEIQKETGFEDKLVVMAEPFHLWVIEAPEIVSKAFPAAKAGLNVKFVKDQSPYRTRKVRILNGAHTALVPVAYLQGLRTVRESVENEFAGAFIKEAIHEEIIPTLDLPPDELKQFADDVIERFQNPFIKHELSSIALNSISKYKVRVLPSALQFIEDNQTLPDRLLFSLACLIRFYKGDWKGEATPVSDDPAVITHFQEAWSFAPDHFQVVARILSQITLWDLDLTKTPGFAERVTYFLDRIENTQNIAEAWKARN